MSGIDHVPTLAEACSPGRLLVVSNRLPVVFNKNKKNGTWSSRTGEGGLVSSLLPVLRDRGGVWTGWPGFAGEEPDLAPLLEALSDQIGFTLDCVWLGRQEIEDFYAGFSNEVLWPLFHDLPVDSDFQPRHWHAYCHVNRKFVDRIAANARQGDLVWVHDYHLIGVGRGLRRKGLGNRLGFFLHIPFPPPDIFMKLPWRAEILGAMLDYDLVGFQTLRDRRNFLRCLQALYAVRARGSGQVQSLETALLDGESEAGTTHRTRVGCFPISIDFEHYAGLAGGNEVGQELRQLERSLGGKSVILSIDRLDYTKGLPAKLRAFRKALQAHPQLRGTTILSLHVVPSRESIPEYHRLRIELEQLISEINGAWSRPDWIPIQYFYHSLSPVQLSAWYRRADVMLVSPLMDGMNLVAKEYCASRVNGDGVLVLSEFAGAAAELQRGAVLINPYDIERTADTIFEAVTLDRRESERRMSVLRRQVRTHDIYDWVNAFLTAIDGRDLDDFPKLEEYVPGPRPTLSASGEQGGYPAGRFN